MIAVQFRKVPRIPASETPVKDVSKLKESLELETPDYPDSLKPLEKDVGAVVDACWKAVMSPAFNITLQTMLEEMHADNNSLVDLHIYMTEILPEDLSRLSKRLSNFSEHIDLDLERKFLHHRGVVITVKNRSHISYLKLDYAFDGLSFNLTYDVTSAAFPTIENLIPWNKTHKYQSTHILSELGRPKRLALLLHTWKDKTYHFRDWNCQAFSYVIWLYFFPYSTGWVPDIDDILKYVDPNRTACLDTKTRAKFDAASSGMLSVGFPEINKIGGNYSATNGRMLH